MRRHEKKIHLRIVKKALFVFLLFFLLIIKLYWVQVVKSDIYKREALKQRSKEIIVYPDRGIIYDRNLIPFTNRKKQSSIYVFKEDLKGRKFKEYINKYAIISNKILYTDEKIIEIPLKKIEKLASVPKGMYVIDKVLRYDDSNLLSHVIGYVNKGKNKGDYGIEKAFDDILKNKDSSSIFFEFDGKKNYIPGGGYVVTKNEKANSPSGVKLTVDYHIQKSVEKILDGEKKKGAVIVAEINTGDILAMASRPNFDHDVIDLYLDKKNMELYNRAVQVSYPPGSLFKVVVLVSALEEDESIVNSNFYCKGYEDIGGTTIKCNKQKGHGYLNLREALAYSCNSVFIQLGQKVGSEKIMETAKKLGFGGKINIGLLEEVEGNLPEGEELLGPAIGNISIGQGNIEVTPLQITNMMMIIANNGIKKDMSIVDSIVSKDGRLIKKYRKDEDEVIISEMTSKICRKYLEDVVEYGTGKKMNINNIGGAAGKTGSAQAVLKKRDTVHGWFSGYFPKDNPRYVITVFIEDDYGGSLSAIPIFEKVAKEINRIR